MLVLIVLIMAGCGQKTPSRDHIPILRQRVFQLQEAIRERNRAAIDSLSSLRILSANQDSDSLLRFVYGPDDDYPFDRLGDYEIFYTQNRAQIDCYIIDSTGSKDRPLRVNFIYEHDLWLLERFEPGKVQEESVSR